MTQSNFVCVGCGEAIPDNRSVKIFCSEQCKQEASYVRYVRRCTSDGRIAEQGIITVLKIRLAHIAQGGYPVQERRISTTLRKKIIKRDKGLCTLCDKPGVDIDHISGSSDDQRNLQLLCKECHLKKTLAHLYAPTLGTPADVAFKKIETRLQQRVSAVSPLQVCDDEQHWKEISFHLQEERNTTRASLHSIRSTS